MVHNVLKASLHIVVTQKKTAGYLAEQFISVVAVKAGGSYLVPSGRSYIIKVE